MNARHGSVTLKRNDFLLRVLELIINFAIKYIFWLWLPALAMDLMMSELEKKAKVIVESEAKMRIDYCPKCGKAGLRHQDIKDSDYYLLSGEERRKHPAPAGYGTARYCPRCNEWVQPENHPYIGIRGRG